MNTSRFAVIGLGQFGTSIARELSIRGAEVMAIDNNEDHINDLSGEIAYGVTMDATDFRALKAQNISDMDAVIVAIGEDFDALLLCVVLLMELNVKKIIARAEGRHQRMILEKIGVKEILSPEDEIGKLMAEKLINPSIISCISLPDDHEIVEILTPPGIANRTLEDINLRNKYRLNLITLKREFEEEKNGSIVKEQHIIGVPASDTIIRPNDTIIVFGKIKDIQRFVEINQ
ncbi:MAG: TrkA family potassium uptake protein [Candidatus Competibacteraceae bacterium]|nr:TrkA family potassium uptake protein [Candidatus Competibacteraceae bacterium]